MNLASSAPGPADLDVSRETMERLGTYQALLRKWNPAINLVSRASLADLWTRHILDSAQLFDQKPSDAKLWVDLGSGGGFPGMVVAILAAERDPGLETVLVESDVRKATFLQTVARETGVRAKIVAERIESLPPLGADVLSARALAPLTELLAFAERHLAPQGRALFLKGANYQKEIDEALAHWSFEAQKTPSKTDSNAIILSIGGLRRV